ncbi:MAG: glycosyltransferase family 39 protein [Candidatus Bathyarchaeia archaeon]
MTIFSLILASIQLLGVRARSMEAILEIIEDPQSFAYYSLALRVSDPLTYLYEWLSLMQVPLLSWGGHLATHFPGYPLLICFGFIIFGKSAQSVVWLTIMFSALSVFPLFYLARLVFGLRVAAVSCLIYSWIPSLIIGIPYMESNLAFFVLLSILLFNLSLRSERSVVFCILGGLILSFAIFLSLTSAATIIAVIVIGVVSKHPGRALKTICFISSTLLPYLILELFFGLPLIEASLWAFRTNMWFYYHLHSLAPSVWSIETSVMWFFLLLGLPLCAYLSMRIFRSLYYIACKSDIDTYTIAIFGMMLMTFLFARLELTRVSSFLVPLIAISVSAEASRGEAIPQLMNSLLLVYSGYLETWTYLSQTRLLSGILGYPIV